MQAMKHNLSDWQSLERDAERGYEIMAREGLMGWEVEVRFDNGNPPQQPERQPSTREEAMKIGREIATLRKH